MIGKKPYQPSDQSPNKWISQLIEGASPITKIKNWQSMGTKAVADDYVNNLKQEFKALGRFDLGTLGGEIWNDSQFLDDLVHGKYNDDILTSASNKYQEAMGLRSSGHITLNNQPVHVEPGSFTVKPKMNIAQTDMYMDGQDGESYTYFQWLNTTGLIINMTIYNKVDEDYVGETMGDAAKGETAEDTSVFDYNTQVNEVLLWWAKTFTTISLWTDLGIPNIKGDYKITQCQQTMEAEKIVKTELELQSYTQDKMEETYYKAYDISDLVEDDQSGDTGLAKSIKNIEVGIGKECSCTGK